MSVMGKRRKFTPEYRRDAASIVIDTDTTIAQVARDLGIGEALLGRWVRAEKARRGAVQQGLPDPKELARENARLRRENERLRMENEFLGKASAFFAAKHPEWNDSK